MSHTISDQLAGRVVSLFPHLKDRPDAPAWLLEQLVDAECHRRGLPDRVSGAFHALALNQGSLLKEEFDLSTHGHSDGWVIGALLVDPREMILFNQRHGFAAGDALLAALVKVMQQQCPKAKVVRVHGDGFAILHGPTAERRVSVSQVPALRDALVAAAKLAAPGDFADGREGLGFTLGALELTVVDPPNWQILGPLVWAECERALMILRRRNAVELVERRVVLDGRLPELPTNF